MRYDKLNHSKHHAFTWAQETASIAARHELAYEPLVTPNEIKLLLAIKSDCSFWDAVHRGNIPHYRINARVIRFRRSEVLDWLAQQRHGGDF